MTAKIALKSRSPRRSEATLRTLLRGVSVALAVAVTSPLSGAQAQTLGQVVSQVLVIDREALFSGTAFGQRVTSDLDAERAALSEETRKIEAALEQEEQTLTAQRATMEPAEFRAMAEAFDEKVQALRSDRDLAQSNYVQKFETAQRDFFNRIGPILGRLMSERGAVVVLDKRSVLLSNNAVDVTAETIARIDATLGDGLPQTTPEQSGSTDTTTEQ